jgi:hypothetical protein
MDVGRPEIIETSGSRNLRYRGRLLYSERGPAFAAERAAAACEIGPDRLYLVASPGLWYGVPELLARLGRGSAVLCVEADPELAELERRERPEAIRNDSRFSFLEVHDTGSILAAARSLGSFRRCVSLRLSGGEAFHAELYRSSAALLQSEFAAHWRSSAALLQSEFAAHWRSKAALLSMGRLWARNIFKNLASLPDLSLAPLPSFGPAIVCGAGPSLERALPFIAEAQKGGRLSVIACDTALSPLLDAGITPNLLVCLEGQAYNLADFTSLGERPVPLLADLSSHPATFRAVKGNKFLSFVNIVPSAFLDRVGALGLPLLACPPLASVGVHAVHVARALSSGPLFLTGLDFSYELGKTHSRGSPGLRAAERSLDRLTRWPGQYASSMRALESPAGRAAWAQGLVCDPALASYAELLKDELSQPGPTAYDLRGFGLPLGAESLGFDAAADMLLGCITVQKTSRSGSICGASQAAPPYDRDSLAIKIDSFFYEELSRLEALCKALKGRTAFDEEAFIRSVQASDYLLWPMPDSGRLRELPQDLLNRLLVEIEYWRWKLGEIASSRR